jgi:hypothetical protein
MTTAEFRVLDFQSANNVPLTIEQWLARELPDALRRIACRLRHDAMPNTSEHAIARLIARAGAILKDRRNRGGTLPDVVPFNALTGDERHALAADVRAILGWSVHVSWPDADRIRKANNPQQSWGFEGEPPEAVIKDSGTRAGTS